MTTTCEFRPSSVRVAGVATVGDVVGYQDIANQWSACEVLAVRALGQYEIRDIESREIHTSDLRQYGWTFARESKQAQGVSADPIIDAILRPIRQRIPRSTGRLYGADRSKAIRDLFRAIGWAPYFRVTKGGYSLGTRIEWAKGFAFQWHCDHTEAERQLARTSNVYRPWSPDGCPTCRLRQAQRDAVRRRVHYVLNQAFGDGREFGDRSDSQSDYFDADYTFHP